MQYCTEIVTYSKTLTLYLRQMIYTVPIMGMVSCSSFVLFATPSDAPCAVLISTSAIGGL